MKDTIKLEGIELTPEIISMISTLQNDGYAEEYEKSTVDSLIALTKFKIYQELEEEDVKKLSILLIFSLELFRTFKQDNGEE